METGASHSSIYTPQNAAFLSAISNAKQSIFIQTPNMNAEPLLNPLLDAVRRGVVITCYLCLGYNDAGQLLPFQNGTNEMIANRLYGALRTDEEKSRLKIFNYVGKDQTRPIHNRLKRRSCHTKLMIIDEKVAIQGMYLCPASIYIPERRQLNEYSQETVISTPNPFTTATRSTSSLTRPLFVVHGLIPSTATRIPRFTAP